MRRGATVLVAAVLAISSLGTVGTGQANAAYYKPCTEFNNEHEYVQKSTSNIKGARALSLYLHNTHTCGSAGGSFMFPANIQGPGMCAAQLGWGALGNQSGNSWYYTHTDADCVVYNDTGWPAPVDGHLYRVSIYIDTGVCGGWTYEMKDLTAGGTNQKCGTRNVASGNLMWSGAEVYDDGDQMGGAGTNIDITGIQYRAGSTWNYFTTSTVVKNVGGHTHSWWVTTAELDGGGHTILHSRTLNH